jgi:tRNA A37 threonylcarbamoyladenosine synthetase subunit TsaC/SUA5/YrdC
VTDHETALAALARDEPLTATSANPGGPEPALDVATARGYVGAYVDGGTLTGGLGSTVVLVAGDAARVIRRGATPIDALEQVLGATPIHT